VHRVLFAFVLAFLAETQRSRGRRVLGIFFIKKNTLLLLCFSLNSARNKPTLINLSKKSMKNYIYIIVFAFLGMNVSTSFGQATADIDILRNSKWAVQLNFQDQDLLVALDFGALRVVHDVKVRPLFSADVQRFFGQSNKKRRYLSGQLGYFNNVYHERALSLKVGYGIERRIYKGFFASWRMEVGVARVKNSDIQYVYENDKWVTTNNYQPATFDALFGPRLDLGYRIMNGANPIDILVVSHAMIHVHSEFGGLPYYGLGIGVKYGF
jgi:hypothetical protein